MRVGWLQDDPGYVGGAELTMAEFKAAAPEGVEVVDCLAAAVYEGLDRYVVGNCLTYNLRDAQALGDSPRFRYHHDTNHGIEQLELDATHIFCSPLQRERMGMEGECIPPALDLDHFRAVANQNHRKGAVCIGRMAYGKGLELLAEYPEPVHVYSSVWAPTEGNARYCGPAEDVSLVLSQYERFVFLPQALEPFGRAVVEAWAAGLQIVVNRNVGSRYWIEENPRGLETAAEDFWKLVLS